MKITQKAAIGLKGQIKVEVIDHTGQVIEERPWQPNLILDQGLNNMAEFYIAQLFEWCAGGTGVDPLWRTTEKPLAADNAYALTGVRLVQSGSSPRPFTINDLGKLVRPLTATSGDFTEGIIVTIVDTLNVDLRPVGLNDPLANYSGKDIVIYSVQQKGLEAEVGPRTDTYSLVKNHNSTTDAVSSGKRTMQRTFVFPPQTAPKEVVTGIYSGAGTQIHRDSGSRNFSSTDVGKYLYFPVGPAPGGAGVGAQIASVTPPDLAFLVNSNAAGASGAIEIYPGVNYGEVGFSHLEAAGNNLNIRVRLENSSGVSTPLYVLGPTPEAPSQQLRVTYKLDVTVAPITSQIGNSNITGMTGDQSGTYAIERLALSKVNPDGSSDVSFGTLEPADPASAGLCVVNAPLAPIGGAGTPVDRGAGASSVQLTADDYNPDEFQRYYEGTFSINEGVGVIYSLGLFDSGSSSFPFVFRYGTSKNKSAEVALRLRFRKYWNRDLS